MFPQRRRPADIETIIGRDRYRVGGGGGNGDGEFICGGGGNALSCAGACSGAAIEG
jgi:hypothetical protein